MDAYQQYLDRKSRLVEPCGFPVSKAQINSKLFPFQRDVAVFDLDRGKSGNFLATGLGKGPIQMEWCAQVSDHAEGDTLIAAPLAVAQQFKRESVKFGYDVTLCKSRSDVRRGVNVTNYDRLDDFDLARFVGVALDESSCIKDWTSKTAQTLIARLTNTPYKLCSSATPSPNDHAELGTHSELLDVMRRPQMLSMFFEHDGGNTAKWALKGHGKKPFFRFVCSWAVSVQKPSDLGYSDAGFDLKPLQMHEHIVSVDHSVNTEGMLFRCPDLSATGLHKEMRLTAGSRAAKARDLVRAKPDEPWIVWVNTDYEAEAVRSVLPEIVEVRGPEKPEAKEEKLNAFSCGNIKWLLTKPSVAGFGMNWQHCANVAFVGLSYSFESLFQAIRRCWRYGQTRTVNAHLVIAETEGAVLQAIRVKEAQYEELQSEMNQAMREEQLLARRVVTRYDHNQKMELPQWLKTQSA